MSDKSPSKPSYPIEDILANIEKVSSGPIDEATLRQRSPIRFGDSPAEQAKTFLEYLFDPGHYINFITEAGEREVEGLRKFHPFGPGRTLRREDLLREISENGVPSGPGGCWIRLNEVAEKGSGKKGTYVDKDCRGFRYALAECDEVPKEKQLELFCSLQIPVAALIDSGGRSIHALIRIGAKDAQEYKTAVKTLIYRLAPLGVDQANKNPSRCTRLPGSKREDGGDDGLARLLYLNPNPTCDPIQSK